MLLRSNLQVDPKDGETYGSLDSAQDRSIPVLDPADTWRAMPPLSEHGQDRSTVVLQRPRYASRGQAVPNLYVWHANQCYCFQLSLLELGKLALGRRFELPVEIRGQALIADVPAVEARHVLAALVDVRLRLLKARRAHKMTETEARLIDHVVSLEQRLTPWLLAILERLDRISPRDKEPS